MLSDLMVPEKDVSVNDPDSLRKLLDSDFKTTYHPTTLDRIQLHPDGHAEFDGQRMPCARGFLEKLAMYIRMPLSYVYDIDYGLFKYNFDRRKNRTSRALVVCCNRGVAINVARSDYYHFRTLDVLSGLTDRATPWKVRSAIISDRGAEINFLEPGCSAAPQPGDIVEFGYRLSNSETGYDPLKGSLFSLRLVCSNGAVMADKLGTARWTYDRRVAYRTSIEKFQSDFLKLHPRHQLQARLYEDVAQRNLLDREVANLWRRLRSGGLPAATVDNVLGVPVDERQEIQATVRLREPGAPSEPTRWGYWEIHNRITAAAQRMSFRPRALLERIGGALLLAQASSN